MSEGLIINVAPATPAVAAVAGQGVILTPADPEYHVARWQKGLFISPSQVGNHEECARLWWYISVAKMRTPQHPSAAGGQHAHTQLENRFNGLPWDDKLLHVQAVLPWSPTPGEPGWRSEINILVPNFVDDITLTGRTDLINESGTYIDVFCVRRDSKGIPEIVDYKFGNKKYWLAASDLRTDVQINSYAIGLFPDAECVRVSHVCAEQPPLDEKVPANWRPDRQKVTVIRTKKELLDFKERVLAPAFREIKKTWLLDRAERTPTSAPGACSKYLSRKKREEGEIYSCYFAVNDICTMGGSAEELRDNLWESLQLRQDGQGLSEMERSPLAGFTRAPAPAKKEEIDVNAAFNEFLIKKNRARMAQQGAAAPAAPAVAAAPAAPAVAAAPAAPAAASAPAAPAAASAPAAPAVAAAPAAPATATPPPAQAAVKAAAPALTGAAKLAAMMAGKVAAPAAPTVPVAAVAAQVTAPPAPQPPVQAGPTPEPAVVVAPITIATPPMTPSHVEEEEDDVEEPESPALQQLRAEMAAAQVESASVEVVVEPPIASAETAPEAPAAAAPDPAGTPGPAMPAAADAPAAPSGEIANPAAPAEIDKPKRGGRRKTQTAAEASGAQVENTDPTAGELPASQTNMTLQVYVDCLPISGATRSLDRYVADLLAEVAGLHGLPDFFCQVPSGHPLAFNGWRGALGAAVRRSPPPPGIWHLRTGGDPAREVIAGVLITLAQGGSYGMR